MNEEFRLSKRIFITQIVAGILLTPLLGIGLIVIIIAIFNYVSARVIVSESSLTFTKGIVYKQSIEIPLSKINSVSLKEYGGKTTYGDITISTGNDIAGLKINGIDRALELKELIQSKISSKSIGAEKSGLTKNHKYIELQELAAMKDKGIITEQEFQAEKAKILSRP